MIDYLWCLICHESHSGDAWATLPCGHYAHAACLQQSLQHKKNCPVCRKHVHRHSETVLFDIHTSTGRSDESQEQVPQDDPEMPPEMRLSSVQASLSSAQRDLEEANNQLRLEAQKQDRLKQQMHCLEDRLKAELDSHNLHAEAMRKQRGLLKDAVEKINTERLEKKATKARLTALESKLAKNAHELARMKMVHGDLSHEDLVGALEDCYGKKKLEDPLVRQLLEHLEKGRRDYGRLQTQAKQEVRDAQQRAKDSAASSIKTLQKELQEVKAKNEWLEMQSSKAASSLDLFVPKSVNKRKPEAQNNALEDLLLDEDELGHGVPGQPVFMIRPGSGFRPPPMSSGASSGSFVLQGADGRGGKALAAAPMSRPALASIYRPPPAAAPLSSMNQNMQYRKRQKPTDMKRAAANDIAKYFNKENALRIT